MKYKVQGLEDQYSPKEINGDAIFYNKCPVLCLLLKNGSPAKRRNISHTNCILCGQVASDHKEYNFYQRKQSSL